MFAAAGFALGFLLLEWLRHVSYWRRQDRDILHIRAISFELAKPGEYRSRLLGTRIVWSRAGWQVITPDGLLGEAGTALRTCRTLRQARLAASSPHALVYR
jgi:hypothetical protein